MKVIQLERFRDGADGQAVIPYESVKSGDSISKALSGLEKRSYLYLDTCGSADDICGGFADIFLDGTCIDTACGGRKLITLGKSARELKLRFISEGTFARSVRIFTTSSEACILPYGLYAAAVETDGKTAAAEVTADIENTGEASTYELEVTILNKRGRRVSSVKKKLKLKPGRRTVKLNLKIRSVNMYTQADPYMYTVEAKLTGVGEDSAKAVFAVRNDIKEAVSGAFISPSAGVIGGISTPETENYRLGAVKALGYNTVRYSGCPSDAALDAMDSMGMNCIVDIFDNWSQPKGSSLAHIGFKSSYADKVSGTVRALRQHPCVVMYSVGNCVEESYGRADARVAEDIIALIRNEDGSRLITAALGELVPSAAELEACGVPESEIRSAGGDPEKLLALGRRCDLFNTATEAFALRLDIVGLTNVSAEGAGSGKPVYFAAAAPEKAYGFFSEFDRADDILGDISDCGIAPVRGDLDETYAPAVTGLYRRMVKSGTGAFIAIGRAADAFCAGRRPNGEPGERMYVYVYTSADVVALSLNGRLIGRKLAGKINNYIAAFETEYVTGTFEAVCYAGGREVERCSLEPAGKPSTLKLDAPKSVPSGGIAVVSIDVSDREGRLAAGADSVSVTAEGGRLIRIGNGSGAVKGGACGAQSGRILALIRAEKGADKITVTAEAEGLKRGRAAVKIK